MNLTDQRPLERALADIVEKYDRMPCNRPERPGLARMIQSLEAEQHSLAEKMSDPAYYKQPPDTLRTDQARAAEIERLLLEKLERWHALEEKARIGA